MDIKKFFEMAATAPAKPFETGDVVLIVMLAKEPFFTTLGNLGSDNEFTVSRKWLSIDINRDGNSGGELRIMFTIEEARAMGYTLPISDKAPVVAWDGLETSRQIGFYDAQNGSLFYPNGAREGATWDNYRQLSESEARAIWGTDYDSIVSKLKD
jgi:hypothetical protein